MHTHVDGIILGYGIYKWYQEAIRASKREDLVGTWWNKIMWALGSSGEAGNCHTWDRHSGRAGAHKIKSLL